MPTTGPPCSQHSCQCALNFALQILGVELCAADLLHGLRPSSIDILVTTAIPLLGYMPISHPLFPIPAPPLPSPGVQPPVCSYTR